MIRKPKIEELTLAFLQTVDFEDSNPFENEFSLQNELLSLEKFRSLSESSYSEIRRKLINFYLAQPRSAKSYEIGLKTFGYGENGLRRLAYFCSFVNPNDTFLAVISSALDKIRKPEPLKTSISRLYNILNECNFSDECFEGVREKIKKDIDSLGAKISEEEEDLDIGRPIIKHSLAPKKPENILLQVLRIISEILESADYVTKKQLLDNQLIQVLVDVEPRLGILKS